LAGDVNRAYRIALFCGACPLVVGVSIFLLWLKTHWEWLETAGLLTIGLGCLFFVVGTVLLTISHRNKRRLGKVSRGRLWLSTLLCAGLLLSNFLTAALIIHAVDDILGVTKYHGHLFTDKSGQFKLADWRIRRSQVIDIVAVASRPAGKNGANTFNMSLQIQGHIDGSADIYVQDATAGSFKGISRAISGAVDLRVSSECSSHSYIIVQYYPSAVTDGQITFKAEFQ
jgi:hypothetical protein